MTRLTSNPPSSPTRAPSQRPTNNYQLTTNNSSPKAFTLIEVLVVIGIIGLLVAISVIAFKHVGNRVKSNAGKVTMQNLATMLAEAQSQSLFKRQPPGVWIANPSQYWNDNATNPTDPGTKRTFDFWLSPNATTTAVTNYSPGALIDEAPIETTSSNWAGASPAKPAWLGSELVANTAIALAMMRGIPVVASSLNDLGSSQNHTAVWYDPLVSYKVGARVLYSQGSSSTQGLRVYVALKDLAVNTKPPTSGDDANWRRDFAAVLDTFNNPILYIPANGLHIGKSYDNNKPYLPGDRCYQISGTTRNYFECTAASKGNAPTVGVPTAYWRDAAPIRSPNGQPFWASAGPDGDLDTPADNLYSYDF